MTPSRRKYKNVLILTSSGGGGLLQAAKAKEQALKQENPSTYIVKKDVLKEWMWGGFGKFCTNQWNHAQQKGDVGALSSLIAAQRAFDYLSWFNFFFCTLNVLFKEDIDLIIDTQPLGTSAITKAIRIYNHKMRKKVRLEKVLVDLPTKKATHFFNPIRRLSKKDLPIFKLTTIEPLLEKGETRREFWQKNCNLSEKNIQYTNYYVRQAFHQFQSLSRCSGEYTLFLRAKTPQELHLMQKSYEKNHPPAVIDDLEVRFSIPKEALVITILLGSQPSGEATLNYVKKWTQIAKEPAYSNVLLYLFVFALEHRPKEFTLFKKITDFVSRSKNFPKHLHVIPFSFQDDDVIAPLFYRSDLTCTRSGGQTAMELMCTHPTEIWVHSETKATRNQPLSTEELLQGIPGWESESARYLLTFQKAKLVTPQTLTLPARQFLKKHAKTPVSSKLIALTS